MLVRFGRSVRSHVRLSGRVTSEGVNDRERPVPTRLKLFSALLTANTYFGFFTALCGGQIFGVVMDDLTSKACPGARCVETVISEVPSTAVPLVSRGDEVSVRVTAPHALRLRMRGILHPPLHYVRNGCELWQMKKIHRIRPSRRWSASPASQPRMERLLRRRKRNPCVATLLRTRPVKDVTTQSY